MVHSYVTKYWNEAQCKHRQSHRTFKKLLLWKKYYIHACFRSLGENTRHARGSDGSSMLTTKEGTSTLLHACSTTHTHTHTPAASAASCFIQSVVSLSGKNWALMTRMLIDFCSCCVTEFMNSNKNSTKKSTGHWDSRKGWVFPACRNKNKEATHARREGKRAAASGSGGRFRDKRYAEFV